MIVMIDTSKALSDSDRTILASLLLELPPEQSKPARKPRAKKEEPAKDFVDQSMFESDELGGVSGHDEAPYVPEPEDVIEPTIEDITESEPEQPKRRGRPLKAAPEPEPEALELSPDELHSETRNLVTAMLQRGEKDAVRRALQAVGYPRFSDVPVEDMAAFQAALTAVG